MNLKLMDEIISRTKGEFYIGVVGSVRSGKSTFIRKFMEMKVLPFVNDEMMKNKILDELPQSAEGKAIMTVEVKFVPSNPINIDINDMNLDVRMVDSVGYIIPNATGYFDDNGPRMVKTPWFDDEITFKEAALIGTKKVIENHSTIGIVMTSDGSIGDFKREDYKTVEGSIINELKELDKPFLVVINTKMPNSNEALKIKKEIEEEYDVSAILVNVKEMSENDIDKILSLALEEFPINELKISSPSWISILDDNNKYKKYLNDAINASTINYKRFKDIEKIRYNLSKYDDFSNVYVDLLDSKTGNAEISISYKEEIYYDVLNELLPFINDRGEFIKYIIECNKMVDDYNVIKNAYQMAKDTGYGISIPNVSDMKIDTPEIIKDNGRYGIKVKAKAETIHMIKVDIESSFEPIIGSYEQSKNMIDIIENNENVWNLEIFGRKLSEMVSDGIKGKISLLPENAKIKFKETLEKIINNSKGGLIAIIL